MGDNKKTILINKKTMAFKIWKYNPNWGSHMSVLIKAIEATSGPVLELGVGLFSTPLIHMMCEDLGRKVVSYEGNKGWADNHGNFVSKNHEIHHVENWDKVDVESTHWGLVFVDHDDGRRALEAIRVAKNADLVVIHDSDDCNEKHYHYSTVYPHYKYRLDYRKAIPNTTVLSNVIDLTKFKI